MLSTVTKAALFLSSYAPLFAIIGLRVALSWVSYVLWGLAVASIIFSVFFFIWAARNISPHPIQVQRLRSRGDAIAYVVTEVVRLLVQGLSEPIQMRGVVSGPPFPGEDFLQTNYGHQQDSLTLSALPQALWKESC